MSKKGIVAATVVMALVFLASHGQAQESILIKNGTIVPVVGNAIPNGSLLIRQGKIAEIGANITAGPGVRVIDASGMYVYPGMVAAMTAIGVTGYPGAGNDQNEIGVSTPHVDPYDALNPEDETIEVTRIAGVTTVHTSSGSANVLNGKSVILNLEGNLASEMAIRQYAAQIFNIGARRENTYPSTLSGTFSMIREKLDKTVEYAAKRTPAGGETRARRFTGLSISWPQRASPCCGPVPQQNRGRSNPSTCIIGRRRSWPKKACSSPSRLAAATTSATCRCLRHCRSPTAWLKRRPSRP
jgi:hypothetical protein